MTSSIVSSYNQESPLRSSFETGVRSLSSYLKFEVFIFLTPEDHESVKKVNNLFYSCIKEVVSANFPSVINESFFVYRERIRCFYTEYYLHKQYKLTLLDLDEVDRIRRLFKLSFETQNLREKQDYERSIVKLLRRFYVDVSNEYDLVKKGKISLQSCSQQAQKSSSIVLTSIGTDFYREGVGSREIQYANESLMENYDFIFAAVIQNFHVLSYLPNLKTDKEFLLKAISKNPRVLEYADQSLKEDRDFMLSILTQNPRALDYMPENLIRDEDFLLTAIDKNPFVFLFVEEDLRKNKDFILSAVDCNPLILNYLDRALVRILDVERKRNVKIEQVVSNT